MKAAPPLLAREVSFLWAGPERAHEIASMHAGLFDDGWSAESVVRLLDHPGSTALVAVTGTPRQTAGFILGQIVVDEAEILSVGVAREWQRRGLGRLLVEALCRSAKRAEVKRLHLEVGADNAAARALYSRLGFQETGLRKGYYAKAGGRPAEDAVTMALDL